MSNKDIFQVLTLKGSHREFFYPFWVGFCLRRIVVAVVDVAAAVVVAVAVIVAFVNQCSSVAQEVQIFCVFPSCYF